MSAFIPHASTAASADPASASDWVVACFCAAWCDTCTQYREKFDALARADGAQPVPDGRITAGRSRAYRWIDIEDQPEWLGDEDVENFPTLAVQYRGRTLFFGTMLPHIGHLERLLQSLSDDSQASPAALPDLRRARLVT